MVHNDRELRIGFFQRSKNINVVTQHGFVPVDERMRVIDADGKLPQAREKAEKEGFEVSAAKTSFKANTKALVENEQEGLAKLIYRPNIGEILGVHILGLHAVDLIHEASNAIALGTRIQDIKFAVHAHPTCSCSLKLGLYVRDPYSCSMEYAEEAISLASHVILAPSARRE